MIYYMMSSLVNFITIRDTFAFANIDRKTDKAKRRITHAFHHKTFLTMSVQNKKITETFKTTFTSLACNKIVPFTLTRTGARITLTGKA